MELNDLSKHLSERFDLENPRYFLDDNIVCHTYDFNSDISFNYYDKNELFDINLDGTNLENGEKENRDFRYAVFAPSNNLKFSEAIIMFHGLNERNWSKYLPWAYQLVLHTNKPVIMFPLAYHMNRSPFTWKCPRLMNKFSVFRKTTIPLVENSTFVNAAISTRMDNYPDLFAMSGIQTYFDVIKLALKIKSGAFEIFENECKIDFFAYSIGALLTETLLMSNPLKLFSESKAFFFCGGSTFDRINGSSRSIMDSKAFAHLRFHLLNNKSRVKKTIIIPEQYKFLLKKGWKSFLAMSGVRKYVNYRKNAFKQLINRIKAIGLVDDFIIPGYAIKETLGKALKNNRFDVDILHFPFKYSHEVPFPLNQGNNNIVNSSFCLVFKKAGLFLSG